MSYELLTRVSPLNSGVVCASSLVAHYHKVWKQPVHSQREEDRAINRIIKPNAPTHANSRQNKRLALYIFISGEKKNLIGYQMEWKYLISFN